MPSTYHRFIRGLVGTSLTWGAVWAAFNTALLFVRYLPEPPNGDSRAQMAAFILLNQSKSALIWGCVYGALFALLLALVAKKKPAIDPLRVARLTQIGAVVGFALPGAVVGFGTLLNVAGIVLSSLVGAGIGAALATVAQKSSSPNLESSTDSTRLPSA